MVFLAQNGVKVRSNPRFETDTQKQRAAQAILHGLPQIKPPHSLRDQVSDCGSTYGLLLSHCDSGQDDVARGANA